MIKYQTVPDGTKAKIIIQVDGEVIKQKILKKNTHTVRVISKNGNEYNVKMSDKVKLMDIKKGDTAIIKTFKNGWLVTDVIGNIEEPKMPIDDAQAQKELEELLALHNY